MESINAQITQILSNLVLLILLAIGTYVVQYLKRRFSQQQIALAMEIVEIAVEAVEQIAQASGIKGKEKLREAIGRARDFAAKYGIRYTDEQWATLIEQAVKQLKEFERELKNTSPEKSQG